MRRLDGVSSLDTLDLVHDIVLLAAEELGLLLQHDHALAHLILAPFHLHTSR